MADYYRFREGAAGVEQVLMQKLPALWDPPLPGALKIHAQYSVLRFSGMSPANLRSGVSFLNFGITWDRAEKVFEQLAADTSVTPKFRELLHLHAERSAAIAALRTALCR
jgi:hypothetical protein